MKDTSCNTFFYSMTDNINFLTIKMALTITKQQVYQ